MILNIEQTDKKMYEADFCIWREGGQVGTMHVKGRPGHMEAEVKIELLGTNYFLSSESAGMTVDKEKKRPNEKERVYRTYILNY